MRIPRYEPPAGLADMDEAHRAAWAATVSSIIDQAIQQSGATQLYDPSGPRGADAEDEATRDVLWAAFPQRRTFGLGTPACYETADDERLWEELGHTAAGTRVAIGCRRQAEYCEWRVERDPAGRLVRVTFSTETPEYWLALGNGYPPAHFGAPAEPRPAATGMMDTVLALYRRHVSPAVQRDELVFAEDVHVRGEVVHPRGSYNPWNRWNTVDGLMHVGMPANGLAALLAQCAGLTVGRDGGRGGELRDPTRHLGALSGGEGGFGLNHAADLAQAATIGPLARAGGLVAPRDCAVRLLQLDVRGWRGPDGRPVPPAVWRAERNGLRAVVEVPAELGYTLGEITVGGAPLLWGGQVAACVTVGFQLSAMRFGSAARAPRPPSGYAVRVAGGSAASLHPVDRARPDDPRFPRAFPDAPVAAAEPELDDDEIQGNVLAGFNKGHQWLIGFRVVDAGRARRWLRGVVPRVASTAQVAAYNARYREGRARGNWPPPTAWLNLALSHRGLVALCAADAGDVGGLAFREGIAGRGLFPVGPEPELLVVIGADHPSLLPGFLGSAAQVRAAAPHWGLAVESFHAGENRDAHEHFGFRDNLSQPAVRGRLPSLSGAPLSPRELDAASPATHPSYLDPHEPEYARPGQPLLWPGEFVLGYPRQSLRHPRDPAPPAPCLPAWTRNGSYLVFLKIHQDVAAFRARFPDPRDAARAIGRWTDGSPLVAHPDAPGGTPSNHFLFADAAEAARFGGVTAPRVPGDPTGQRCPFSAHIRKVNPRDDATWDGALMATLRRRMLRRGITYGPPFEGPDGADRGLLFVSYQASIEEQFEQVWSSWVRDPLRPAGPGGVDPLFDEALGLVRLVEGGYFFAPAISALDRIARG